jgi:hypothetical protein
LNAIFISGIDRLLPYNTLSCLQDQLPGAVLAFLIDFLYLNHAEDFAARISSLATFAFNPINLKINSRRASSESIKRACPRSLW